MTFVKGNYQEGEIVLIHSLGENYPGEFEAMVFGKQDSGSETLPDTYVVELRQRPPSHSWEKYPFSCIAITEACLKRGANS